MGGLNIGIGLESIFTIVPVSQEVEQVWPNLRNKKKTNIGPHYIEKTIRKCYEYFFYPTLFGEN